MGCLCFLYNDFYLQIMCIKTILYLLLLYFYFVFTADPSDMVVSGNAAQISLEAGIDHRLSVCDQD